MDCGLCEIIQTLAALAIVVIVLVIIIAHASASKMVHLQCHEKEKGFLNAEGKREPFSSIHDPPTKELSVVVPSYNEELRCECVALKYTKKYGADKVRVLTQVNNRGKGGAVKMGTQRCRGKLILMADADGATKFADIEKMESGLKDLQPKPENMAIACGSRAHLEKESVATRSRSESQNDDEDE
ncbi:UNVERIFIED_CONTAM: hypothetical protein FKN15_028690 [Acipenser sinensis]